MRPIRALLALFLFTLPAAAQPANQPAQQPEKPRLAVSAITATRPALDAARFQGQAQALDQIIAAADNQLLDALADTRRFDLVARSDLATVLKEQDLADSGLMDPADPQTARAFALAGARYVATVSIDNFQDAVATADFKGGLGNTTMERRTIQLQATLKIYDTTTGVLLDSTTLAIEDAQVRETLPGATQTGRLTNALLADVSHRLARDTANAIMNTIAPARVLAYTLGQVTLNRAEGTGVEAGQIWRVYHAGPALIDPDTGENLGREEIPVGWVRITEVTPRFSKAEAIEDTGITAGAVLRLAPDGLPAGVDPNARPVRSGMTFQQSTTATDGRIVTQPGRFVTPAEPRTEPASLPTRRVAVFVRDVSDAVPDRRTDSLEALVTASLGGGGVEVISRAAVLNAVAELSGAGANRGGSDPTADAAARLLSDQASAVSLARTLGADALLITTVADLSRQERSFNDPALGVSTEIVRTTLTLTWDLIAGDTGGSIGSGLADATDSVRRSARVSSSPTDLGALMKEAAAQVGPQVRRALAETADRTAQAAPAEVAVSVRVTIQDLSVPDIRKVDGVWTVMSGRYNLIPAPTTVMVDGFQAGSTPAELMLTPGPHRIRLHQPGFDPVERFIVAREGMELDIPMALSASGMQRWQQNAAFLETLKTGAALRENEQKLVEGLAEFLRQARVNLDTSSLQSIEAPSLWEQLLDR
jgi:curli biogenesis system outer membrane secretion channel CsgG